jgi:hypothetical protein
MYAGANMGHPSRGEGFVFCSHHGDADELHYAWYPNLISDPQAAGSVLVIKPYESVSAPANLDSSEVRPSHALQAPEYIFADSLLCLPTVDAQTHTAFGPQRNCRMKE